MGHLGRVVQSPGPAFGDVSRSLACAPASARHPRLMGRDVGPPTRRLDKRGLVVQSLRHSPTPPLPSDRRAALSQAETARTGGSTWVARPRCEPRTSGRRAESKRVQWRKRSGSGSRVGTTLQALPGIELRPTAV